jgi:hypothetical protein
MAINMGRRSSGGSFFKRSGPAAPSRSTASAVPPRQASSGTATQPGFGRVMMEGMAFGAGSEIAHQAVRGVMGSGGHEGYQQSSGYVEPCSNENQGFMSCLQYNKTDISQCQSYFDMFKQCKGMY